MLETLNKFSALNIALLKIYLILLNILFIT